MNMLDLLVKLESLDTAIELKDGHLKIDAPKGVLTSLLLSELKANKNEIIKFLEEKSRNKFVSVEPVEKKEYYALSPAQKRLYFLQQLDLNSTGYNMPMVLPLGQGIKKDKLESTLKQLVARHESLRTSIERVNEEVVQRIHPAESIEFSLDYYKAGKTVIKEIIKSFVRPFDLSLAPLIRSGLITLPDGNHVWMVDVHHIVSDGISHTILTEDFMRLYETGTPLELLPVQYKDFAQWQNQLFASGRIKTQEDYWLKLYEGEIPRLNLATDYKRPAVFTFAGDRHVFRLEREDAVKFKALGARYGGTLYMNMMAALNTLFYKYTGQTDIIIGSGIAGRRHADFQGVVGMFVNTLAMRNYPAGEKSYKNFLKEVIANSVKGFENQDVQFEELVEKLDPERDTSRNPLFDILMVVQNFREVDSTILVEQLRLMDENSLASEFKNPTSKFDLTFFVYERGDDVFINIEYYTGIFTPDTIRRLVSHFKNVVRTVIEEPGIKLKEIAIISEEEKQQVLYEFNDTARDYPWDKSIPVLFEEQVERTPDHVALTGPEGETKKRRSEEEKKEGESFGRISNAFGVMHLTYKELNEKSNRLAHLLIDKGVLADNIVGIMMDRSVEMIVGILGILKAGSAYLPIDPEYPQERIDYMLKDSEAKLLVTTNNLEELPNFPTSQLPNFHLSPATSLAYIIYTSGSTGKPKGVMVEHSSVVNLLYAMQDEYPFTPADTYLLKTSYIFDVSVTELFGWAMGGGRLAILEKNGEKDPKVISEWIEGHHVTHINFVPSMFNAFAGQVGRKDINRLSSLKYIFLAGEALLPEFVKKFQGLNTTIRLENIYGPTESSVYSSEYSMANWSGSGNIPIGKPMPNIRLYIVDKYNRLQPTRIAGELTIAGMGLARGYLNRLELTAEKFVSCRLPVAGRRLYKTGDLGRWLPDGNIEFLGRIDHQVKIRGFRIELGEIESRLLNKDGIKEAVVITREGENGDKYLCAYVVSEKEFAVSEIREYLAMRLPDYMIPSYFVRLEKIPLTPNGKVDRRALPELELQAGEGYIGPRDKLEKRLVELWSDVLGIEEDVISINSSFFQLGGHSLKSTLLVSKIHKELNVKIPLVKIFKTPSIRELAKYIKGMTRDLHISIEPMEEKEYYVLPSAQKRLYIIQQMELKSTAYNIPAFLPLVEEPDVEKLELTFIKLVARHDSLRTSFHLVEEQPVQKVHQKVEFSVQCYGREMKDDELEANVDIIIDDFVKPFDLSHAPLLRAGLAQVEKTNNLLLIDMHHIISDGISVQVLLQDFMSLYSGRELSSLKLQYKDFAGWEKSERYQAELLRQEMFWLEHFKGNIPVLNLPTDYARPVIQRFEGNSVNFRMDREETRRLKELAAAEEVTLYMVLHAIFTVLFYKVSGQEDIVIGTGVAGRRHVDLHPIVGIFVNTLAIRSSPSGEKNFSIFLQEVKENTLDAFENQEYPFEELVEKLEVNRDTSRNPLFDVMLILQNQDTGVGGKPGPEPTAASVFSSESKRGGSNEPYLYRGKVSKFDLTIFTAEIKRELNFRFEYSTALFRRETIDIFITYFKEIAASDPGQKLKEMKRMPGPKKQEFLRVLNRRLREELEPISSGRQTLQGRLAASFYKASRGSGAAIRYKDRVITYKHLHGQTNAIANWLIHERRIQPETIIGVLLEDRVDVITAVIGILKARCVFVPLDSDYPHGRLETMIRDVDIRYVITDSANAGGKWDLWANPGKFPELIHWDKLHSSHARGRFFDRSPQLSYRPPDNIYIYFTSGSTGIPRAMMGVNRSLLHFIHWEIETFCVDETSRFSQLTTPVFDAFLRDIFVPLCSGGVICIPGSKDTVRTPVKLARWLDESQITMMHCVPGILRSLNSAELSPGYFRELKFILLSGEKLEPPDLADWYAVFQDSIQLVNLWGTSETTLAKTCYFVQPPDAGRERIPVGKPINGAGVITLDEEGEICDPLISGGLYILTPFRTAGYLNDPGLNNERFISAPFDGYQRVKEEEEYDFRLHKTGDLGRLLPDGNIDVLGRNDRQVKIRGVRVELEEIERVLVKHPLLIEAAVLMKEISAGSEILCGYITGKTGIPGLVDRVREYLSARLPDYMIPAKLTALDKLPRKPNGKIDYHALPDMMEEEQTSSRKPRNKVEEKLLELWTGILKIENIAINRSFFELGGNSLNIMTLISRIHKEFDVRISLAEIFNNNTIEKQASIVMAARKVQYESIEPMEKKEYYELSAAQKRLYFVQQLDPGSISYNMLLTVILEGKMEKNDLENVFKRLIRRHESIRTSYIWVHESPVQKVRDNVDFGIEYYDLLASGEAGKPAEEIVKAFIRPFDLSCAPLLRVGLIKIGSQSHILMVDMHHIISDGTSMEILKEEFMAVYQGKELAPLRLQYKDYSHWQNKQIDSPGMERQKAYWLNQFEGGVPTLHFLTDYPREGVENFEGQFVTFPIEEGLSRRLRELTNETGTTLYIVLLTVYMILLSKYTGQEDIIVGSGIAGRNHTDLDNIIGMFINMLAMRGQPVKSKTFGELLEEVREHTLAAFENQDYQFDELVRELGIQRDWKRNPLFDTQFTFQNMEAGVVDVQVTDLEIQHYEYKNRSMPFDLSLNGMEIGERIGMSLGYVNAFFKHSTIKRTAVHYIEILEQVLENRDIRLEDISLSHGMAIGRTSFSQDEYTGGFEF